MLGRLVNRTSFFSVIRACGLVALLLATALLLTSCGGGKGDDKGEGDGGKGLTSVVVASDLPLTGSSRAQTESMVQAIKMRIDEAGGKAGSVSIKYVSKDDSTAQAGKWDEAKCTQNMSENVSDDKVVVVIGPFNSGCAQVQIKVANQAGLAMISPANTAVGLTKSGGDPGEPDKYYPTGVRNYLRVALADDLQGRAGAMWAKELGAKKVYLLNDKETYGKGISDQFAGAADKNGLKVVGDEGINPQATNYRELAPKIKAKGTDLVYYGGITQNNAGQLVKDIKAADPSIIFMGPDGIYEQAYIDSGGKAADGSLATFGGVPPEKLEGAGAEFVKKFTDKYGQPQAYTAYAYDAAGIALEAIQRCAEGNGVTRKCVIEEMFKTKDFEGALGKYSITETGDTTLSVLSGLKVKNKTWQFEKALDLSQK